MTRSLKEGFYFEDEALPSSTVADLLAPDWLRLDPKRFTADFYRRKGGFKPKEHIPLVRSAKHIGWLRVENGKEKFFVGSSGSWEIQNVWWTLPEGRQLDEEKVAFLVGQPGFNSAQLSDPEDDFWQATDEISHYETFGRDHSHLPKIQNETGETVIDISGNPGRPVFLPGICLQAAPRMWFGGKVFDYIPRNRLLSFPAANRIEELPSGVLFIELFSDPFAAALPENRAKQKAFRDWIWMDELDELAPGILQSRGVKDPTLSIETGSFPHGGVRRVTQWMGEDRRPTRSSRAAWKLTVEYGEGGEVVWKETVKITGES